MATAADWIKAFRLRTLPLALSSIGMAGFLAYDEHLFNAPVFCLCILTTLFLQILSNLANDYGDFVNGADSVFRVGPSRAVQSGAISGQQMKKAIALFALLSLLSGVTLLFEVRGLISFNVLGIFFIVGMLAIVAAITYTAGKKPYGYAGLGDIAVFLFFGIVGVCGTFYLQTGKIPADIILPAVSCGLFSTGVLNVNNLRDIDSDRMVGKMSIPVRLGPKMGRVYHLTIIVLAWFYASVYAFANHTSVFNFLYFLTLPLFIKHLFFVLTNREPRLLDPYLKQLALSTLLFVITFGISISFF